MIGAHQRNCEPTEIGRAAGIHWIEILQALRNEPHAEIVVRRHRRAVRPGDVERIADVIGMTVGEHDMFDAFASCRLVGDESWIAGEEWIDQHGIAGKVEAKGGVTIPGDLHGWDLELAGSRTRSTIIARFVAEKRGSQVRHRIGSTFVLTATDAGSFPCRRYRSAAAARRADRS